MTGNGNSSVKFALLIVLFVQLCCARSWAVDEPRAKNYAQDPRGIVRVDVLGYENDLQAGGDPSALIGGFEAEGTCLTYVFDSEKSFAYKVRLALEDAEGTTYVPIIDVNPGSPTDGVDPGCDNPIPRPIAVDDDYGTDYAGKNVLSNDTDLSGLPLTAVLATQPGKGTVTLAPDGTFVYTPDTGARGDDSFTYYANNGTFNSKTAAKVSLVIPIPPPINRPPVAVDDRYSDDFDGRNVLSNDFDPDGDTLSAILVSPPAYGTVALNSDGTFIYTPDDRFTGEDSFTYKANDGELDSNVAIVSLRTSVGPNRPPVAVDDNFGADYGGRNVLDNDFDPDGDELSAILVAGASNGEVQLNPNGTFSYTPNSGFSGDDSFTYVANDGELNSEEARVSLTVKPPENLPPVARPDFFGKNYDGKSVLTNDTDPNGDKLIAVKVSDPDSGELTLNPDGTFVFKPFAGFSGETSFTYKARDRSLEDPNGLESDVVSVNLEVTVETPTDLTGKVDKDGYSVEGNASPNELKVSMRIDRICPKLEPANAGQDDLKQLCDRLRAQGTTARQAVDALGAITPEELAAIPQTARIVTLMRSRNTGARLMRVREGEKGISVSGLNISHGNNQVAGGDLERMLNEFLGGLGGGASADGSGDLGNLGVFIQGDLSFGDQDDTDLQSGYDYDAQNIALGADYRFGDSGFAGASVSYAWSTVDFDDNAGKTETDSIALAVFGSYYLGDNGYIDGTFSYDWSDIKTRRNIRYTDYIGSIDRKARGDTDGNGYYISLNAGYGFHSGGFNLIPALNFFYLDGEVDSFQEKGADGWDLAVDDQEFKSTSIEASAQLSYAFSTDWGVLSPYIRLGYNREFEDSADGIRFRFVNDPDGNSPGSTIRIQSDDPDDTFMMYSAGATAQFKYGISGFVSYQLLGSYDNLSSETVSFGMRWETTF